MNYDLIFVRLTDRRILLAHAREAVLHRLVLLLNGVLLAEVVVRQVVAGERK